MRVGAGPSPDRRPRGIGHLVTDTRVAPATPESTKSPGIEKLLKAPRALRAFAVRHPLSSAYALILVLVTTIGSIAGFQPLRQVLGTGYRGVVEQGHWWSPITSVFVADQVYELVLALAATLVVIAYAERVMGFARTALAFSVTAILGAGVGVLIQIAGVASGEMWSRGVSELWSVDPFTAIFGTAMTASSFSGALLRRRIRVLTVSASLVLLLYSGQPSDFYRLIAVGVGLGLGILLHGRRAEFTWRRGSDHETRALLAAVVAVLAVGPVATVLSGGRFGVLAPLGLLLRLDVASPTGTVDIQCLVSDITKHCVQELTLARLDGIGPVLLSCLPLVTLIVASFGLARGRRFAALLAIVINVGMAAISGFYYGLLPVIGQPYRWQWHANHYWEYSLTIIVSILVPLAAAIGIALTLRRFPIRADAGRTRRFLLTIGTALIGLTAVYVGAGWLLRDGFSPSATLMMLLADAPERFIPVGFLRLEPVEFLPTSPAAALLYQWVGPVFWIVVISSAILSMGGRRARGHRDDPARLRSLLATGGGSLAYMAAWEGNSLWFDSVGTTVIAYRVVGGVAITTTEPIGPAGDGARAVAEFARLCDDRGWIPVFYSLHESWRPVFERMGWQLLGIAEETVLRPRTWQTTGKKWQDVRSSISRAERAQVRAVWTTYRALPLAQSLQIAEISEQWVQEKGLAELGFTLGGLDELRDSAVQLMLAIDANERVQAVTSWLPCYRDGVLVGWTLDFMRRHPESMNGVMEFLIAETAEKMKARSEIEFLSLSAAPLARSDSGEPGSIAARLLDVIGRRLEPVYGFRSLLAFKRKFQPEFQPLLMAYPDPVALPTIGVALARAYLPTLSLSAALSFARSANRT